MGKTLGNDPMTRLRRRHRDTVRWAVGDTVPVPVNEIGACVSSSLGDELLYTGHISPTEGRSLVVRLVRRYRKQCHFGGDPWRYAHFAPVARIWHVDGKWCEVGRESLPFLRTHHRLIRLPLGEVPHLLNETALEVEDYLDMNRDRRLFYLKAIHE